MKTDAETPSLASTPGAQWYRIVKNNAECACRYGDNGIYATLMYQFTGDRRYAQIAWTRIANGFLKRSASTLVGNYAREYSAEMVLFYDWLTPALSAEQRQQFLAKLNEMFTALVTGNRYTNPAMPIRTADTRSNRRLLLRPGVSLSRNRRSQSDGGRPLFAPLRWRPRRQCPRPHHPQKRHRAVRDRARGGRGMDGEL